MPKKRRRTQVTNQLLSCFVTPKEKALILKAMPEEESMSNFLRKIIMLQVKLKLKRDLRANKHQSNDNEIDESNNDSLT
ncbi:hypothetical protein [Scytonema hofmannii]|uniref:hypothetical protein n=1 Tax=Scytonema hofmannii TaxID=34078 RepID=UPI000475E972|nr:hypothetical protein [Scytonema hofmannii]